MQAPTVMALFCEDIREEKGDILTLIGLMPDTVNLETTDGKQESSRSQRMLGKLSVYTRINFDPDLDIEINDISLVMPNGDPIRIGDISPALVSKARQQAKEQNNILAGIVSRASMWGFAAPEAGSIRVVVTINGEKYLAGALRFQLQN